MISLLSKAMHGGIEWRIVFVVTLWRLWTRRCSFVMKDEETDLGVEPFLANVMQTAMEVMRSTEHQK
ncbi:hypothetical protein COLO4_02274, partial [Corchorus olitorius]